MTVTTNDCRKFLVDQVRQGNISADWACDRDMAEDAVYDNFTDTAIKGMNSDEYEKHVSHYMDLSVSQVKNALLTEKYWKRRTKYNGSGTVKVVREFVCDTPDNLFDGQVGYQVLELLDGSLILGENIGD